MIDLEQRTINSRTFQTIGTALLLVCLPALSCGRELKQEESGAIRVDYGEHFIFRTDGKTYAIVMKVAENSAIPGVEGSEHAIHYMVSQLDENGSFQVIGIRKIDEREAGSAFIETKGFELEWSWNSPKAGWLYIGGLPKGTEYFKSQLKSLDKGVEGLAAEGWIPAKTS